MRVFSSDRFVLPLPVDHRFPMAKYRRLRERVEAEGIGTVLEPPAASREALARVHEAEYLDAVETGRLPARAVRRIGFPWSRGMVERSRRSVGATLAAARAALEDGVGVNLAGGTHHAWPDRGEGFCVFNDVAVAARTLLAEGAIGRAAVVDLDVHHGNATAAIFADDPRVFTLSIHGAGNWPFSRPRGDLDRALPDGTGDEAYLEVLDEALEAVASHAPDLVFYVSGADPYRGDRWGRLGLTVEGLERRDERVFEACRRIGAPVAVTMGGGYAPDLETVVEIHLRTVRAAVAGRRVFSHHESGI